MKFTKMHGIGNDYIYVNDLENKIENPRDLAAKLSDRHFGIGSDGLILIKSSEVADFRMDMYNSDGSQAQMCGNGIRCVGKYVYDKKLTNKTKLSIETLAGIKLLQLHITGEEVDTVTVDMGEPILAPERIPTTLKGERIIRHPMEVLDYVFEGTCVSMGNPHVVIYLKEIDALKIEMIGPVIESHPYFPERINAEFVQVLDRHNLKMRVWERGAGETFACGTGACAVLVASVLTGKSERRATLHLLGGTLEIEWNEETNHVFMTGSAATVFEGEVSI